MAEAIEFVDEGEEMDDLLRSVDRVLQEAYERGWQMPLLVPTVIERVAYRACQWVADPRG